MNTRGFGNVSYTENGAMGYRTTTHPLVDLNFMVSALRNMNEEYIVPEFVKAYYESPKYAVKWLFFLRDILEGLGERRTFRICMKYLAISHPDMAEAVMGLIPEYGRYDDLLLFADTQLWEKACKMMKAQLQADIDAMEQGRPVSLLAKWLPSANTSSKETRNLAYKVIKQFGMTEKKYRKTLSKLRAYGNVVEVKISANKWSSVDYGHVPAKANLKYEDAFTRHDGKRREEYLKKVYLGDEKLNAKGLMPYEIVHRIISKGGGFYYCRLKEDLLAELMWKKMVEDGFKNEWGFEDCIVVADGSGSMYCNASGSHVKAIEICNSLAIYFAQQLKGIFHEKAISFSETPKLIDLSRGESLKDKLEIMDAYADVANTNIEAVFDLLLDLAVKGKAAPEEIPKQVLIISDMEFDEAVDDYDDEWDEDDDVWEDEFGVEEYDEDEQFHDMTPLFDKIEEKYKAAGYKMPRLIFWNVCGRTNTIPKVDNEQGLCLLSGFSQNAMKIAENREKKDPYESLIAILDGERYRKVEEALNKRAS